MPIICYRVFSFLIVLTYTNYVFEEERNSLTVSLKNVFFYELIRIMFWKDGLAIKILFKAFRLRNPDSKCFSK